MTELELIEAIKAYTEVGRGLLNLVVELNVDYATQKEMMDRFHEQGGAAYGGSMGRYKDALSECRDAYRELTTTLRTAQDTLLSYTFARDRLLEATLELQEAVGKPILSTTENPSS